MNLSIKQEDIEQEAVDMFSAIEAGLNDAPNSQTTMDAFDALEVIKVLFWEVLSDGQKQPPAQTGTGGLA